MADDVSTRARVDLDALAALEEEHHFLVRSLVDLEHEHAAGDLDDHDFNALRDDYEARAAAVQRLIEGDRSRLTAARPPRSRARRALSIVAVIAAASVAGTLVAQSAGRRDAGQTVTGEIRSTVRSKLDEARSLGEKGALVPAFKLYAEVLDAQPSNVEALAYRGWFIGRAGELDRAKTLLDQALAIDPGYADAEVFLAFVRSSNGENPGAKVLLAKAADDGMSPYAESYARQLLAELG